MQGKRLLLTTIAGCSAILFASSASANMSIPNGWYLEGNLGTSHMSGKSYPGKSSTSGFAGSVNFGYKLMPYFGLEIGYAKYADATIKQNDGTKAGNDSHYSVDIAGKGILPFSDSGFEAFAKLGAARAASKVTIDNQTAATNIGLGKSSHSSTGLYLGLGAQYNMMPELAVVGQWARAQGGSQVGDFDLYTLGLSFIFG